MSTLVNRLVVEVLRNDMFPTLPQDIRALFPTIQDPLLGDGPNIVIGHLSEMGVGVGFPIITVTSSGAAEALTRGRLRHLNVVVEYWMGPGQTQNIDGRRVVSILYEYSFRALQDKNFSGDQVSVKRCYETDKSDVLFEAPEKLYHISNTYRLEALSRVWY